MSKANRVYKVTLDEFTQDTNTGKRHEEPNRLGAVTVLARDADEAVAKAKKPQIGLVYEDEVDGEPYKDEVVDAKLVSIEEVCEIDII